jgi:GNAT superfamily N-acetyltransferase
MSIEIMPLRVEDAPKCQSLSDEAGWNQNAHDWTFILRQGGAYGVWRSDTLIASAAITPYGATFGWICMVLVTAQERRQGLASRLMQHRIDELAARGMVAGLDATPAGREVYLRLGFEDIYPLTRFQADAVDRHSAAPSPSVRRIGKALLPAIFRYDAKIFGEDRQEFLAALVKRKPSLAHAVTQGDRITGFVLGRDGRRWTHIGPLVADNAGIAIELLDAATAEIAGPILIDVPDHHPDVQAWLRERGFTVQRGYMRMLRGRSAPIDDPARVMAIAGPEFG